MSPVDPDRPSNRLHGADVEPVLQQLDTATRAQLPIAPALQALAEETPSGRTRRALQHLVSRIERGESLASALSGSEAAYRALGRAVSAHSRSRYEQARARVLRSTVAVTAAYTELKAFGYAVS